MLPTLTKFDDPIQLEAYKRLKISEVWFWEDGTLAIDHLRPATPDLRYEQIVTSEELPELDIALLLRCINMTNHVEAVRIFRQAILP